MFELKTNNMLDGRNLYLTLITVIPLTNEIKLVLDLDT